MALVNRTKVTISLDKEIAEWLEKQAEREDRNKGRIIERLLKEYKAKIEDEKQG